MPKPFVPRLPLAFVSVFSKLDMDPLPPKVGTALARGSVLQNIQDTAGVSLPKFFLEHFEANFEALAVGAALSSLMSRLELGSTGEGG